MQAKAKWWLALPPAIALILVLGPLQDIGDDPTITSKAAEEPAVTAATAKLPSTWHITSTLIGVLLIGAVGVLTIAKLRGPRAGDGSQMMRLRQSLRLSPRHFVHAVEFDDQILLLGECDAKLGVLVSGGNPATNLDDREVAQRTLADEDGAVPRDLLIPQPPPTKVARPTPPSSTTKPAAMANFKSLLQRVSSAGHSA